jgi:hypothetical protein
MKQHPVIDIDQLSESELIDLNHRIVARLRFLHELDAHTSMLEFRIGERVTFQPPGRGRVTGIIARYNKKSVSLVTDDGQRWNVAPQLLERARPTANSGDTHGKVIALPRPDHPRR